MQRALDAGAVVFAERADTAGDEADVLVGDVPFVEIEDAAGEAGLGAAAQSSTTSSSVSRSDCCCSAVPTLDGRTSSSKSRLSVI